MAQGFQCIVLHAHLPFIRHPEHSSFLEERWLFEAITETYIPLLLLLERLQAKGRRDCLTLSLSPPLLSMLADPLLQARYLAHLDKLRQLAASERTRTRDDRRFAALAGLYQARLDVVAETFEQTLACNLIGGFVALQQAGTIELITSAATHGYLPLLKTEPAAVRAQLQVGAASFRELTGLQAAGVWLPECGYYPGLEAQIEAAGFHYFFVESHGILNARPSPYYGLSAPLSCPNGVAAFGRDPASSRQVWSHSEGYPGDPCYRDFYRDIGHDLALDYVRPYILDSEQRIHTGFKYHRITGRGQHKLPYQPDLATERVQMHALDFVTRSRAAIASQGLRDAPAPLIVSPYDAELFGHWWFEGPDWLEAVVNALAEQPDQVQLTTPSAYLAANPQLQSGLPSASSWGDGGYNSFWLNPSNDWIYPQLHHAARRMQSLARHCNVKPGTLPYRALQQAARSLLLAQSSDWAFIMKTDTSKDYALRRTRDHLARFNYLEQGLLGGHIDERRLQALEVMDPVFPNIDPAVYR